MKIVDERFELLDSEKNSAFWVRLEKHLQERLKMLRSQNDGDHDPVTTAKMRGQIKEIKSILALAEDRPQVL